MNGECTQDGAVLYYFSKSFPTGYMAIHVSGPHCSTRHAAMSHGQLGINSLHHTMDGYHVFTMQQYQCHTHLHIPHSQSSNKVA